MKSADCVCCHEGLGRMEVRGGANMDSLRYSVGVMGLFGSKEDDVECVQ